MACSPLVAAYTWFFRIAFLLIFVLGTVPVWLIAVVVDLLPCCKPRSAEGKRRCGRLFAKMMSGTWRLCIRLTCWLCIDREGLAPLQTAGSSGRQAYICANHVSYLDIPLLCVLTPWSIIADLKVLMSKRMLNMPGIGRLARLIGHLPIPFTSKGGDENFGLNRDLLGECMQRVDEHVQAGGHLIVFPEGALNSDWKRLKQFRGGGFEMAAKHDMEVWGVVIAGTADTWPTDAALGGGPSKVYAKAVLLHESAREAALRLAGQEATLQEQGRALANDAQAAMQRTLDEMIVGRWTPASVVPS